MLQSPVFVSSRSKSNTRYLLMQKIHGHQTRQGAELMLDPPTLKATWPFDYLINVMSRGNLKKLNLFKKNLMLLTSTRWWVAGGCSARKRLSRHGLLVKKTVTPTLQRLIVFINFLSKCHAYSCSELNNKVKRNFLKCLTIFDVLAKFWRVLCNILGFRNIGKIMCLKIWNYHIGTNFSL